MTLYFVITASILTLIANMTTFTGRLNIAHYYTVPLVQSDVMTIILRVSYIRYLLLVLLLRLLALAVVVLSYVIGGVSVAPTTVGASVRRILLIGIPAAAPPPRIDRVAT